MDYIISQLSEPLAKKIFGNIDNALKYLKQLSLIMEISETKSLSSREIKDAVWKIIVKYWEYYKSIKIIRNIFKETEKYQKGYSSDKAILTLLDEWKSLNLGLLNWPCSQGDFDGFVQRINNSNFSGNIKDEKVKDAAVRYRRLKELNTVRNDFLETLIFEKNEEIVPTLSHRRGVDFFINGISFDQKVAKSPTKQFMKDFGPNWKDFAKNNPYKVAEYLYKYQDEGRFDADPRLYIVYLDEDIPILNIKETISKTDILNPKEITFEYKHKIQGIKFYKTNCIVILLSA